MGSFADWRSISLVDGVLYRPPEGMQFSAIRVTEQVRPLKPLSMLIDGILAQLAPVTGDLVVESRQTLTTFEGEHAALVCIRGRQLRTGGVIEYVCGFVFGDDCYTPIVAYCTDETQLSSFRVSLRAFLLEYELRLGGRRMRRFIYTPPPTWQGRARGLRALWYPMAFPRHRSHITITPATPCEQKFSEIEAELHEVLASRRFHATRQLPKVRISSEHGLRGWLWQLGDDTREVVAATFLDDRFGYHLRMETVAEHLEADRAVFQRVLRSVQPVPSSSTGQTEALLRAMTPA